MLTDVPEDAKAVTDETFGPTLTVQKVRDAEEGVEKANATSYGLAGAVFSRSKERAMELAGRMRSGMTSINSVDRVRLGAVAALRRGGRERLRPHPRRRRAAGVHPGEGHHQPALRPAGAAHLVQPAGVGRAGPRQGARVLHGRSKLARRSRLVVRAGGTPRPRSDEERQLIFRAALRVMRVNGYAEAQISDILAEAGLGTRAFYRHFSSKDDLVIALFEENAATDGGPARGAGQRGGDGPRPAARLDRRDARPRLRRPPLGPGAAVRGERGAGVLGGRRAADPRPAARAAGRGAPGRRGVGRVRQHVAPEQDAASVQALVWVFFEAAVLGRPLMPRDEARAHVLRFCLPALGLADDPAV